MICAIFAQHTSFHRWTIGKTRNAVSRMILGDKSSALSLLQQSPSTEIRSQETRKCFLGCSTNIETPAHSLLSSFVSEYNYDIQQIQPYFRSSLSSSQVGIRCVSGHLNFCLWTLSSDSKAHSGRQVSGYVGRHLVGRPLGTAGQRPWEAWYGRLQAHSSEMMLASTCRVFPARI